jgi:transcriptional regulator with XRE-family HTH domain
MVSVRMADLELRRLGERLRAARLSRDEPMAVFAQRIDVSIPTLRAMERGLDSVAIKHWVNALWALDRLSDLGAVLEPQESVLDLARREEPQRRQRASRRHA